VPPTPVTVSDLSVPKPGVIVSPCRLWCTKVALGSTQPGDGIATKVGGGLRELRIGRGDDLGVLGAHARGVGLLEDVQARLSSGRCGSRLRRHWLVSDEGR
jgi:hypothetical protein